MTFVQIIDYRSDREDEIRALTDEWDRSSATNPGHTVRRTVVGKDRNDPTHFVVMVFFDSYEAAMQNSELPDTQEFSGRMAALVDGPPNFIDLDVIQDETH